MATVIGHLHVDSEDQMGPCSRDREPKSTRKPRRPPLTDKQLSLRPQTALDSTPTLTLTEHYPPFVSYLMLCLFNALAEIHFMNKRLADFQKQIHENILELYETFVFNNAEKRRKTIRGHW